MAISSKRAEYVAVLSLILGIVFFVISLLLGRWSGVFAISAVSWVMLSSVLVWFALAIQFHQRALAEQERLDMSQLAGDERAAAIFQAKGEQAAVFAVAQRRLDVLEKWFIPAFSVILALYQTGIGLYLASAVPTIGDIESRQPLLCAICMAAIAFVSFLISRYASGMSSEPQWRPLRAGGSFFLGVALLCFALAISLAFVQFDFLPVIFVVGWVIPILLILLGLETALNFTVDIYRPRLKGQYSRSAFDTRLLGSISEPGGIFHTAASAVDYQFGFKVSQTWFYKLLEKAILPLILFSAATLYLMSCIVIVAPDEQAVIERFGNPLVQNGREKIVGPGLAIKWPWPVDIAYKYPVKKVSELTIGYVPKVNPKTKQVERGPLLWGEAHHEEEYEVLVAAEQSGAQLDEAAVPISLVMATVPVHYRVKNLYDFLYNNGDSEKFLEAICYRELAKLAAGSKVEVDNESDMARSLLGAGRDGAKQVLTRQIQNSADEHRLGVEIVFVGLQGIHPPPEVAPDYQKVVGAVQQKQAAVLNAHAERNKVLSALIGSVVDADDLYALAAEYQLAKDQGETNKAEMLGRRLDKAFADARGDIFKTLKEAQSYAFEKATLAKAAGERFAGQLKAYRAAEEFYMREQRLRVFEEALEKTRKYVVVADKEDTQVFIIDVKEKLTPSLYDIGGIEETNER